MQLLDPLNKRNCFVERIVTPLRSAGMAAAPFESKAYLRAPTMAAINFHVGGFADYHVVRTNAFMLDERIARDTVAPLLHVAKIIERPIPGQAQLLQRGQSIDHGGRGTLLIARAQAVDDTVLVFALKRVPLPLR